MMVRTNTVAVLLLFASLLMLEGFVLSAGSTSGDYPKTEYDFYLSGNTLFHSGGVDRAISAFKKCIELNPDFYYARVNLGVARARMQRFEAAIQEFTFCIDGEYGSGADRFVFYFNRALARKANGEMGPAQDDLATLQELDPARAEASQHSRDYLVMDTAYIEARNEADRDRLFDEYRALIADGKIVVRKVPGVRKSTEEYEALGLIEGTLEEVSRVLADYARYPEFMPNVKEMIVRDLPNGEVILDWQLLLPMGFVRKYRLKCWVKNEEDKVERFWKNLPWPGLKPKETIVDTYGQWILERFPENDNYVLAYYRVYTDPGRVPLGTGWIVDTITQRSVPDIIKRTRKRVKDLFY